MAESTYENEIIEGFLCPICKADLRSFRRLKTHFQENHPEDQDAAKAIKDLLGKATKKILKINDDIDIFKFHAEPFEQEPEIQEIGFTMSHTKYFKSIRSSRLEHYATETNKLIIRLDKLLGIRAADRRQHEQQVVEWLDGSSVKLCPQCAKSFNLARRQHHCRLCGAVMCNSCTTFLSDAIGRSIIAGCMSEEVSPKTLDETNSLRICIHCMDLLDYRRRLQMNRNNQPVICDLYNKLRTLKKEIEPDIEQYKKMCSSLYAGETTYTLSDTQLLRAAIARKSEILDIISKKISEMPVPPEVPRAATLQIAVRRATSNFIKDYVITLPPLPTPAQLLEIYSKPQESTEDTDTTSTARPETVKIRAGWSPVVPSETSIPEESDDPLVQQINNVKGYIAQAKSALRFEEVASLKKHLQELEDEYYRQSLANREGAT